MKNVFLSAAMALTATTASAGELAILGGLEYAVEAEVTEATVGVEYAPAFVDGVTLTPVFTFNDAGQDFAFESVELTVGYAVTGAVDIYATVDADEDFDRTETTVGVSFRF